MIAINVLRRLFFGNPRLTAGFAVCLSVGLMVMTWEDPSRNGSRVSLDPAEPPPSQSNLNRGTLAKDSAPRISPSSESRTFAEKNSALLSDILSNSMEEGETAQRLFQARAQIPTSQQADLFRHIANLLSDNDFGMVRPILLEDQSPREVLDVLYEETLNRPDFVKLPVLVDIAFQLRHPLSEESRSTLEFLIGEDLGPNRHAWDRKISEILKSSHQE